MRRHLPFDSRVAVRCPSCGAIAETRTISGVVAVWPDHEVNILHPDCDLVKLYGELGRAAAETRTLEVDA